MIDLPHLPDPCPCVCVCAQRVDDGKSTQHRLAGDAARPDLLATVSIPGGGRVRKRPRLFVLPGARTTNLPDGSDVQLDELTLAGMAEIWAKVDIGATGFVTREQLVQIILATPPPVGLFEGWLNGELDDTDGMNDDGLVKETMYNDAVRIVDTLRLTSTREGLVAFDCVCDALLRRAASQDQIRAALSKFDTRGSGCLSTADLTAALTRRIGGEAPLFTVAQAEELMGMVGRDGDIEIGRFSRGLTSFIVMDKASLFADRNSEVLQEREGVRMITPESHASQSSTSSGSSASGGTVDSRELKFKLSPSSSPHVSPRAVASLTESPSTAAASAPISACGNELDRPPSLGSGSKRSVRGKARASALVAAPASKASLPDPAASPRSFQLSSTPPQLLPEPEKLPPPATMSTNLGLTRLPAVALPEPAKLRLPEKLASPPPVIVPAAAPAAALWSALSGQPTPQQEQQHVICL